MRTPRLSDVSATSLHQSSLFEIVRTPEGGNRALSGSRLRLFRFGRLVWERTLGPQDPIPQRAWVHDSGQVAIIGKWGRGQWLSLLDPVSGRAARAPRCLDGLAQLAEWTAKGPGDWLRFSTAQFIDLPRGLSFSLRTAPGHRLLFSRAKGDFVPNGYEQEALADLEAERALSVLGEAKHLTDLDESPHDLTLGTSERLGAATLCAAEQHLLSAIPALRALEWGGGPCRPGLRRLGDLDPSLADLHDLRRLAQRALLRLGEQPRPLAGATVVRVGPAAALHTSLGDRAQAVEALAPGITADAALRGAGQPDDVGCAHWDYGLYTDRPRTIRVHWKRNCWGPTKLDRVEPLAVGAATSRYDGFEQPLD
ncbi:MAG: hypothetical protein JKY65_19455 [Planctomycetes bacterium]|nr:hypothetical protein [Planctomycetota bacterium]